MNFTKTNHPSEEQLIGCALNEADEATVKHLAECEQCREFVNEYRSIEKVIESIGESEIPVYLDHKVQQVTRMGNPLNFLKKPYLNDSGILFLYGMLAIISVILFYVMYVCYI